MREPAPSSQPLAKCSTKPVVTIDLSLYLGEFEEQ